MHKTVLAFFSFLMNVCCPFISYTYMYLGCIMCPSFFFLPFLFGRWWSTYILMPHNVKRVKKNLIGSRRDIEVESNQNFFFLYPEKGIYNTYIYILLITIICTKNPKVTQKTSSCIKRG